MRVPCGLGVFHSGVAVGGREYAYGYCPEGSGVYTTAPGENPMYVSPRRGAARIGRAAPRELDARLRALRARWAGDGYDLLQRNCNHFAEDMARELGCEQLPPGYVNRLARAGDSASEAVSAARSHPLTVQLCQLAHLVLRVHGVDARARQEGIVHGGAAVASELARGAVPDGRPLVRGRLRRGEPRYPARARRRRRAWDNSGVEHTESSTHTSARPVRPTCNLGSGDVGSIRILTKPA